MSVEYLKLQPTSTTCLEFKYGTVTQKLGIRLIDARSSAQLILDRNQAHLLYLYLQEHLGYAKTQAPSS